MRPVQALWLVIAAFVALCAAYIDLTPYRQQGVLVHQRGAVPDVGAPDERQHANYVQHILDGKGLPVFRPGSPDLGETYQSHQPPLYYLLAAGWAKVTAASPTDRESGRRLRYLNLVLGVVTLLGVFYAAKWGLDREDVALAAVAVAGLMPMFVALHAAVGNDPLLFLLCTWTLAFCAHGIRFGWDWKTAMLAAICAGLGLLTKTTALALIPTIMVALLTSVRAAPSPPRIVTWAIALAVPVLIGLPWMVRNQSLYGDPFAITAFNQAFVGSPQATDFIALVGPWNYWVDWVGWWTGRSFVGMFGYMDIWLLEDAGQKASDTAYRLLLALLLVPAVGWVASLRGGLDRASRAFHLTGAVLLAVVLVLFVRFNLQYFQGQARYLYPAIGPIAVGLGAGLCHVLGRRKEWAWAWAGGFLLVVQALALQAIASGFPERVR